MNARRRLVGLLLLGAVACATPPGPPRFTDADYPGLIRAPALLGADVLWQQRVTARWGERAGRGFDAALQKQGDVLTLLGLSPLGSVGFVVRLEGERMELHNETGEELPFPPRFILLDVQRVFFPWLAEAGEGREDGLHTGVVSGERIEEVVASGRLLERRFTRIDGRPAGTIRVRYVWSEDGDRRAPARAVLENGWFDYRLTIETLEETRLPAASEPAARS